MQSEMRAIGCLLGGAFGDAVGAPVEFLDTASIHERFGPRGNREPLGYPGAGPGSITDDTQQALAICRGLVSGVRFGGSDAAICRAVWAQLRQWCDLQRFESERRAPGSTSLFSLARDVPGSVERPTNDSDSCGAVMRAHPVGLYHAGHPRAAFRLGVDIGALTHGGVNGYAPAGALTAIIADVLGGTSVAKAVSDAADLTAATIPRAVSTIRLLRAALAAAGRDPPIDLNQGLAGWRGDEALAMAVTAALRFPDNLADCCAFAATHDGDSDSVASIAGAIVGAHRGAGCIPVPWDASLEHAAELTHWAKILVGMRSLSDHPSSPVPL